jgi:hypothetical protein
MTDFGLAVAKTQQAAGNQPQAIEDGGSRLAILYLSSSILDDL